MESPYCETISLMQPNLFELFSHPSFLFTSPPYSASSSSSPPTQVETVGDKYMTVSGLPETCDNHAKCIARLALDVMDVAQNVMMGSMPVVSLM